MVRPCQARGAAESDASVRPRRAAALRAASKITRARNQKRPGTSGGGRKQEGEALNQTPSVGIRLWAVLQRGSAHEPPPENVGRERDAVGMRDRRRVRA